MSARRGAAIALAAGLLLATAAHAHDYWLQADRFRVSEAEPVVVRLILGDAFETQEEKAFEAARTERFELRVGDDVQNLLASTTEGARPVFSAPVSPAEPFLFTLVRNVARVEMTPAEFNDYVAHEDIPGVRSQRAVERERYWRFLKLLGRAGENTETDLHHRFTGMQFEIVLLQNPFTLAPGDEQIAQVLFETKPLPGVVVSALHRAPDGKLTRLRSVTDERGVARFTPTARGVWLVRAVYLRPCKGCEDADWESFWTAYTFEN